MNHPRQSLPNPIGDNDVVFDAYQNTAPAAERSLAQCEFITKIQQDALAASRRANRESNQQPPKLRRRIGSLEGVEGIAAKKEEETATTTSSSSSSSCAHDLPPPSSIAPASERPATNGQGRRHPAPRRRGAIRVTSCDLAQELSLDFGGMDGHQLSNLVGDGHCLGNSNDVTDSDTSRDAWNELSLGNYYRPVTRKRVKRQASSSRNQQESVEETRIERPQRQQLNHPINSRVVSSLDVGNDDLGDSDGTENEEWPNFEERR